MRSRYHKIQNFFLRPTHCVLVVVGLFIALTSTRAQRPGDDDARRGMERIDQEEGARRLEAFRRQRLEGDYVFEFQLEHKPRRAPTVRYDGIMWGTWNDRGALTRFQILSDDEAAPGAPVVELVVQNGADPSAWIRRNGAGDFEKVSGAALFEPLLPGLTYSIFDLQMPFIYWSDFIYEGPSLVGASRVAQNFLMIPPEDSESVRRGIKGVNVGLDDTYNALWRVEVIDEEGSVRSKFAVESFKKIQEQYIVKRISLTDYPSKDRTTFNVTDASVGLKLDSGLFEIAEEVTPKSVNVSCCKE